jgi:5-methyltetrahydrofolate--homocysteine methyltransferase
MLRHFQKKLRATLTQPEAILWEYLRNRRLDNFKFRRQQILAGYIADFVCHEEKLIIELDGAFHEEQQVKDAFRTKQLGKHGYRVLRFWNRDILNDVDAVLHAIYYALKNPSSGSLHSPPSPTRGEGNI